MRPAPRGQERLREAAKLGFSVAVVPKANAPKPGKRMLSSMTPTIVCVRDADPSAM